MMMTRLIKYADNRRGDDLVYRQYTHDTIFWLFYKNFQIKMNTQNKKNKKIGNATKKLRNIMGVRTTHRETRQYSHNKS